MRWNERRAPEELALYSQGIVRRFPRIQPAYDIRDVGVARPEKETACGHAAVAALAMDKHRKVGCKVWHLAWEAIQGMPPCSGQMPRIPFAFSPHIENPDRFPLLSRPE